MDYYIWACLYIFLCSLVLFFGSFCDCKIMSWKCIDCGRLNHDLYGKTVCVMCNKQTMFDSVPDYDGDFLSTQTRTSPYSLTNSCTSPANVYDNICIIPLKVNNNTFNISYKQRDYKCLIEKEITNKYEYEILKQGKLNKIKPSGDVIRYCLLVKPKRMIDHISVYLLIAGYAREIIGRVFDTLLHDLIYLYCGSNVFKSLVTYQYKSVSSPILTKIYSNINMLGFAVDVNHDLQANSFTVFYEGGLLGFVADNIQSKNEWINELNGDRNISINKKELYIYQENRSITSTPTTPLPDSLCNCDYCYCQRHMINNANEDGCIRNNGVITSSLDSFSDKLITPDIAINDDFIIDQWEFWDSDDEDFNQPLPFTTKIFKNLIENTNIKPTLTITTDDMNKYMSIIDMKINDRIRLSIFNGFQKSIQNYKLPSQEPLKMSNNNSNENTGNKLLNVNESIQNMFQIPLGLLFQQ